MIEIRNLVKKYGSLKVVDSVSTEIKKGKITSIIGPNGAGKSTLLSIISRLLTKDDGDIIIDGKNIEQWDSTELAKRSPF